MSKKVKMIAMLFIASLAVSVASCDKDTTGNDGDTPTETPQNDAPQGGDIQPGNIIGTWGCVNTTVSEHYSDELKEIYYINYPGDTIYYYRDTTYTDNKYRGTVISFNQDGSVSGTFTNKESWMIDDDALFLGQQPYRIERLTSNELIIVLTDGSRWDDHVEWEVLDIPDNREYYATREHRYEFKKQS